MNDYGGNVIIKSSTFENVNTCGGLIRNKRYLYFKTMTTTTAVNHYNERMNNY